MDSITKSPEQNGLSTPPHSLIDTTSALATAIDALLELPTDPPSIYMAITGALSRTAECSMSILRLYIHPTQVTYLIDAQALGKELFSTPGKSNKTLKDILESYGIPKVFFDVRDHSYLLFRRYSITLGCVLDLQLMELATRYGASRKYVKDWTTCLENDAGFSDSESRP